MPPPPLAGTGREERGAGREERGAGLLSSLFGFLFFLLLLGLAVNVSLALYTRTVLSSAAFDAARHVAGGSWEQSEAAVELQRLVGKVEVQQHWTITADEVAVTVRASTPGGGVVRWPITRTVRVRREELR